MGQSIYDKLGVRTLINAAGTFTEFGGSLMPPPVIEAWQQAAKQFVDLRELQDQVGNRLAKMLGVEAALVTGGAASSILLGTAAMLTRRDPRFLAESILSEDGQPFEVLRQRTHRDVYDRQVSSCGVRIVEVESIAEFHERVSTRTLMAMAYNVYDRESPIQHNRWLQLAREHNLPTLLDAAADTPPVSNLSYFSRLGYDLVAFSGGKAIRGPQGSGLLVGRQDLIELAKLNAVPNEGTIGRVAKVSKEDIVALYTALELFVSDDPNYSGHAIERQCQNQLRQIADCLAGFNFVTVDFVTPALANCFPHLQVTWDAEVVPLTTKQLSRQLREGQPAIATGRVYGTGDAGLLLSAINLEPGQAAQVAQRLVDIFHTHAISG